MLDLRKLWLRKLGLALLLLLPTSVAADRIQVRPNHRQEPAMGVCIQSKSSPDSTPELSLSCTPLLSLVSTGTSTPAVDHQRSVQPDAAQPEETSAGGSFLSDLGLNLLSELLGIVATVLVIDRLIKRREDQRWRPARNMLLASLLELTDQLLFRTLPSGCRLASPRKYFFGKTIAIATFSVRGELEPSTIQTAYRTEADVRSDSVSTAAGNARRQLEYIFRFSGSLLEAELFHLLLSLDRALSGLREIELDLQDGIDEEEREDFAELALSTIQTTLALQRWLVDQSDLETPVNAEAQSTLLHP